MSGADIYHEMIIDYSRNPLNFGKIENPDVTYHDFKSPVSEIIFCHVRCIGR